MPSLLKKPTGANPGRGWRLSTAAIFFLAAGSASADIYLWRDATGAAIYTDRPPFPGAQPFLRDLARAEPGMAANPSLSAPATEAMPDIPPPEPTIPSTTDRQPRTEPRSSRSLREYRQAREQDDPQP